MFLRFLCALAVTTLSPQGLFAESNFDQDEAFPESELPQLRYESFVSGVSPLDRKKSTAPEFRVVGWNVGQARESAELSDDLQSNITGILGASNSPDLLVLVEVRENIFQLIKKINFEPYGYDSILPIAVSEGKTREFVILIWKSRTLRLLSKKQSFLSVDLDQTKTEGLEAYSALRERLRKNLPHLEDGTFDKVEFLFNNRVFSLYPVHFINIWPILENYAYEETRESARSFFLPEFLEEKNASIEAKKRVLKSIITESLNPHAVLVENFLSRLNLGFDAESPFEDQESILVIGDFNAFPRIDGVYGLAAKKAFGSDKAWACAEMEKTLKPIYAPEGSSSFPSASYMRARPGSGHSLLIDLGYFRGPLWRAAKAEVLPLSGSDHYPVLYSILHNP
ncbi:MAG: hypothetical protein R3A80_06620 [Bdellovibrionota bacterium]